MKKIMFNDRYGLTKAVIEGRKTMTRRLVPPRFYENVLPGVFEEEGVSKSYYKVDEIVAVAQSYKDLGWPSDTIQTGRPVRKGNHDIVWDNGCIGQLGDWYIDQLAGWENKMFVLAELCKHHIRITGIKVERLQDISLADCLKEGIIDMITPKLYPTGNHVYTFEGDKDGAWYGNIKGYPTEIMAFAHLIDKVSGKGTWNRNPWVFAYTFELVKGATE